VRYGLISRRGPTSRRRRRIRAKVFAAPKRVDGSHYIVKVASAE
jgi:hypothetical protein